MDPVVEDRPQTPEAPSINPPIAPGALLAGRYRIGPRVGAGGMATIYHAQDETLDREVAVKVLHPHLADDASLLERFRAEARAAAGLLHPHIVNVFDQGVADLPFIVMEFVDGPSLRDVLSLRGRLPPREALAVLEPVCAALARAHAMGLIHRDVKPENVLVASQDGTVKVADFGIARALASANLTETGMLLGSVHYLAPELVRGGEASPASDQYAVGVVLFELLTGRKPLPADTPTAVAMRHAREPIPAPSTLVSDVSPELDAVVAKATAKDPDQRYPDLASLGAAIRAAVPGGAQPVVVTARDDSNGTLIIPREALETSQLDAAATAAALEEPAPADRLRRRLSAVREAQVRRVADGPPLIRRVAAALAVVVALGVAALGAFLLYDRLLVPVQTVPEVVNLEEEAAVAQLQARGLEVRLGPAVPSRTVPEGVVIGSEPGAGTELRRGAIVTISLSSGPAIVEMPMVLERTEQEAVAQLEDPALGFTVQIDREPSDTVPAGIVQAQLPLPGEDAREGQTVVINVSQGIEQVPVPDVVGQTLEDAERLLAEARLTASVTEQFRDDQPTPGIVVDQSVDPDSTVDKGSAVNLIVSLGSTTVELPDLRGRPIDEGIATIQGLGLQPRVVEVPVPTFGPFVRGEVGRVEEQAPGPGTVQRGQEVLLYTYVDGAEGDGDDDNSGQGGGGNSGQGDGDD